MMSETTFFLLLCPIKSQTGVEQHECEYTGEWWQNVSL